MISVVRIAIEARGGKLADDRGDQDPDVGEEVIDPDDPRARRARRRMVELFWSPGIERKPDGDEVEDVPAPGGSSPTAAGSTRRCGG